MVRTLQMKLYKKLFNHHINMWRMLKLKMLLWIEVQIWKVRERRLQGNSVLDKNIRNYMKKLSTSKRKNEIGFNLDIQSEH